MCDIGWDNNDAAVACRQAGYTGDGERAEYNISTCYMCCQLAQTVLCVLYVDSMFTIILLCKFQHFAVKFTISKKKHY